MTYTLTPLSFDRKVQEREAIRYYLADLPVLDRKVLYLRFAEKKNVRDISYELSISPLHAERILARAEAFVKVRQTTQPTAPSAWPVSTGSPLPVC
jgi:DNA-directed RNA polymerase specialized sigma subunit